MDARVSFRDFVNFSVRLQRTLLIGEHVTSEVGEERKATPNVAHRNFVRVGKDKGRQTTSTNLRVQLDHFGHLAKDVGKRGREFSEIFSEANHLSHFVEEFLRAHLRTLVAKE